LCSIDATALAYHSGDFGLAVQEAERALQYSRESGYSYGWIAAVGNLGMIHVSLGNVEQAAQYLQEHRTLARDLPGLERKSRDTYADLLMLLGRLDESGELLAADLSLLNQINDRSWDLLSTGITQVRLFRHYGQWSDAVRLAETLIKTADAARFRWYGVGARSSAIEPLIRLDRHRDAVRCVMDAEALAYEGPLDVIAEVMLAKSSAFAAAGFGRMGARFAETCMAAARAIRDLPKQVEARNVLTAIVASRSVNTPLKSAEAHLGQLVLTRRYDRSTSLPTDGASTSPLLNVSMTFDTASNAQLLAREGFSLFYDSGSAQALALIVKEASKPFHITAFAGWSYRHARMTAARPNGRIVIRCGSFQNHEYELIIEPKRDIESRCVAAAIEKLIKAALTLERLRREEKERASLWPLDDTTLDTQGVFVATSMTEILATAKRIAPTTLPVLLTGETGTGKEVLARAIHRSSPRSARPFVPFNCAAVPRDMVESQLFGYRRGAFTGAQEAFSGVIRGAAGGTLFLDEIGDLSPEVQPKFLRFLETGEIQPLGDAQPMQVDVRVIAATNAHLDKMVAEGRFREDLFYRLNVIRFRLPALRERREEIPPLVQHFVRRFTDEFRKGRIRLTEETMEYLLLYRWPGNVRQLENELRRVIALAENDQVLTPAHLSPEIRESRRTVPVTEHAPAANEMVVRMDQPLAAAVESLERHMVQRAIDLANGHVTEAAKMLGVSRKGLFLMRKRWGIGEKGSSIQSGS
jgi:transcriptional regulator with PAS, ATPase and Fis domain